MAGMAEPGRLRLVATCALGLEELLAGELRALGVAAIEAQRGAVKFAGSWRDVWRANWRLRTANRVLVVLGDWPAADGDALAAGARRLVVADRSWDGLAGERLFAPDRTLAIRATSSGSQMRDVRWLTLKTKDGLVDGQRDRFGRRSSIAKRDPDLALRVWLHRDHASLLLDTSGLSLDHRGYRRQSTEAPVREQIAAACVLASGWDGRGPVVDPMCGSGTLLAEAGWWALGWPPGNLRRFAFHRLPNFDREAWDDIRREPVPRPNPDVTLHGVDRDGEALHAARVNLAAARLADRTSLERGDAFSWTPPAGPGLVLVNPAWGERLDSDPAEWRRLGDLLKQRYAGWRAVVLAGDPDRGKHIGLKPSRRLPVQNGPIDARILVFELY